MHILFLGLLTVRCADTTTFGLKTIRSADDSNLFISAFQKIFRLRTSYEPLTGLEPNVVKFVNYENGFKIIVNDEPMCLVSKTNKEIVSCDIIPDEKVTIWSIEESPRGKKLRTHDDLCLSQGKYDDRDSQDGYRLIVEDCNSELSGYWVIRPIEPLVFNGDIDDYIEEQNQTGRPASIADFMNHNPANSITSGWQYEDRQSIMLPENIKGFY